MAVESKQGDGNEGEEKKTREALTAGVASRESPQPALLLLNPALIDLLTRAQNGRLAENTSSRRECWMWLITHESSIHHSHSNGVFVCYSVFSGGGAGG